MTTKESDFETMSRFKLHMTVLSVFGALLFGAGCTQKAATPQGFPPPQVGAVTIEQGDVPIYGDWVATLDGFVNANIQP